MAKLIVKSHGQTIQTLEMQPGQKISVGRDAQSTIVLAPEKGISREHFRIVESSGRWQVQLVSKYGDLILAGQKVETIDLENRVSFSVPPYDFSFSDDVPAGVSAGADAEIHSDQGPMDSSLMSSEDGASNYTESEAEEKTVVGGSTVTPFIKTLDSYGVEVSAIPLDSGDRWLAGRESSCTIHINDQRVSRKQFEIKRMGSQYILHDLGSVNGTLVNRRPVTPDKPVILKSGDQISVLETEFFFELRDLRIEDKINALSSLTSEVVEIEIESEDPGGALVSTEGTMTESSHMPQLQLTQSSYFPAQYQNQSGLPANYQQDQNQPYHPANYGGQDYSPIGAIGAPKGFFEKNRPFIIGFVVLILAFSYYVSNQEEQAPTKVASTDATVIPGSKEDLFNKLPEEQKNLVRHYHRDARNFYFEGKYELAQATIQKLFEILPAGFEDSKDIEIRAREGIALLEQKKKNDQKEKDLAANEALIIARTALCEKKIDAESTLESLTSCLTSNIIGLNPGHPRIDELKRKVQSLEEAKRQRQANSRDYAARVDRFKNMYAATLAKQSKLNPLEAIESFEVIKRQTLPDPDGIKSMAAQKIEDIKRGMVTASSQYRSEAERLYQEKKLKDAVLAYRKAKKAAPLDDTISEKANAIISELRKQMQEIYQEGILEESFGNVEGAKEKWKRITDTDIPDGEYYKKAYTKLKKYGAY